MTPYSRTAKTLHWMTAFIVISLIIVGLWMGNISSDAPYKGSIYGLHKSFGLTVLILGIWRLLLWLQKKHPALPQEVPRWEARLAYMNWVFLYGFLILFPLSGYVMGAANGYPVKFFGLLVPNLITKNEALAGVAHQFHIYGWYVFAVLIIFHILGVLKLYFLNKTNLLSRMK